MGFYLRKSVSLGPLRFNFSKRGVGVSAGVRGARVGVDARGRNYVHAGRGGIYYRQRLAGYPITILVVVVCLGFVVLMALSR